jgi:DNA polymerase-1
MAMVRLFAELERRGREDALLLQVHDELILEVARGEEEEFAHLLGTVMARTYPLSVPIEVELKAGPSWYEMQRVSVVA